MRILTASAFLFVVSLASRPVLAQQDCTQQTGSGEVVGTLLGAAVGGLLGSHVGGGTGNKVAIGAGVLAGGLLGNRLGKQLDCKDQSYHAQTANQAFETKPTGTTSTWVNPDTGHSGTVTPTRTYTATDGEPCRDFTQTVTIDGNTQQAHGTACRQPDGTWKIVSG